MTITKIWACQSCEVCDVPQNIFGTLLCVYEYLTSKPGSNPKMWFKEHSPQYRELISYSGKVITIWRSSQNVWRVRTDQDNVEDWGEMATLTGAPLAYLLASEVKALLFYMPDLRHYMMFSTFRNTGVRIGESRTLTRNTLISTG